MNLIAINGYIGSGKDTVGKIIQDLVIRKNNPDVTFDVEALGAHTRNELSNWKIKKFAGKLKQIATILTGISTENFEDQNFKDHYFINITTWNIKHRSELLGQGVLFEQVNPDGYPENAWLLIRVFLQDIGTNTIRARFPFAWVNSLFIDYKPLITYKNMKAAIGNAFWEKETGIHQEIKDYPNWIITDCRFPNEAQAIKDRGGIVVRVNRPETAWMTYKDYISGNNGAKHPSETSLDDWEFDYTIDNLDDLDYLIKEVNRFMEKFNILTNDVTFK